MLRHLLLPWKLEWLRLPHSLRLLRQEVCLECRHLIKGRNRCLPIKAVDNRQDQGVHLDNQGWIPVAENNLHQEWKGCRRKGKWDPTVNPRWDRFPRLKST